MAQNKDATTSVVKQTLHSHHVKGVQCDSLTAQGDVIVNTKYILSTKEDPPYKCESFCICDAPITNFVGREDLLKRIHSILASSSEKTTWLERTVIIYGLGGMGKSELARKYVAEHINDPIIQNVAWIDSETKASLENSMHLIAEEFGLDNKNVGLQKLVRDVYKYFSKNFQSGLFIFDNVEQLHEHEEEPYFGILNYLPTQQLARLPLILITSRTKDFEAPKEGDNSIGISELSEDHSVQFLVSKLKLTEIQKKDKKIQDAVRMLAQVLQGYPLGLTLAAANICCDGGANAADEIQKYITTLDVPNGGWMNHKHSRGSTSKYTLVMDSVWKATTNKIKIEGVEGECAMTLLNIMAFLPTDGIRKSRIDEIIEFGYSSLKDYIVRGYSILEMYSLINSFHKSKYFTKMKRYGEDAVFDTDIQIYRHVQRCTRESLDSVRDYSYLICVGRFLCEKKYARDIQIHRYLKQRKWPDDSFLISVEFLCTALKGRDNDSTELAMDLSEAIETEDQKLSHLLRDGYKTLIEMSLYILSKLDDAEIKIPDTQRSDWNTKYESTFDTALRFFPNHATRESSPLSSGMCGEVMDEIKTYLDRISGWHFKFNSENILTKLQKTFSKALDDPNIGSRSFMLNIIYRCLHQGYRYQGKKKIAINLKVALQLHLKYYKNDSSLKTEDYWKSGGPIPYSILREILERCIEKRTNTDTSVVPDLEKSILDVFVSHGGPQVVQHHLSFITSITELSPDDKDLFGLIMHLITEFNCREDFKKTPQFLHLLKQLTEVAFSLSKSTEGWAWHVKWLLMWFALFPGNCSFEDTEGRKWSLDSVTEEIQKFICLMEDDAYWTYFTLVWQDDLIIQALRPHLVLSESNPRDGWIFKTAVEIMDKDLHGRLRKDEYYCRKWKTEFEHMFKTREYIPPEIWKVGRKYGFIID